MDPMKAGKVEALSHLDVGLRAGHFTGGASLHHEPLNARPVPDFEWHGTCKWTGA
jgi:hypothetical protein